MAVVTFWNNNTGKIGQSHSVLAIATYMAMEHNYRILLISTGYNEDVSMQAFGLRKSSKRVNFNRNMISMDTETGIESLSKLALSNRLTPDIISNYTKMIFKQRLEILSGPLGGDYNKIYESCIDIINNARSGYDIVFVDLNNGYEDNTTREIINMSDIIVMNIEQKMSDLDEILRLKSEKIISNKKTLYLLNRYDRFSKYTAKNVSRYIGERKETLTVPYNNLYAEAVEEGTLADMFLNPRIRKIDNIEDKNGFFMNELRKDSEAIVYKMQELQMRV